MRLVPPPRLPHACIAAIAREKLSGKETTFTLHFQTHKPQEELSLYIGYYGTAKGGRTGHNPYACLPGSGWGVVDRQPLVLKTPYAPQGVEVNAVVARKGEVYNVMLHWYQSAGTQILATGLQQNLQRFWGRLLYNRNDGAYVQLSSLVDEKDISSTKENLSTFAEQMLVLIPETAKKGSFLGGLFLTLCLALFLISYIGGIAFGVRLMIVTSLIGLVWNCWGWSSLRVLAFPLGFLFFMVPIPDTLLNVVSFPLQLQATKISTWVISLFSIPVYREGNMLYFVQTQLEVAEACSGIRSIVALTMLSVLMAYLSDTSWQKKAFLVACAIPVALLANILRVSGTGILAHFYGDKVARGFLHDFSGLVVFLFDHQSGMPLRGCI